MTILFALMDEYTVIYEICIFRGHIFRLYPDGHITKTNDEDRNAARSFNYI